MTKQCLSAEKITPFLSNPYCHIDCINRNVHQGVFIKLNVLSKVYIIIESLIHEFFLEKFC